MLKNNLRNLVIRADKTNEFLQIHLNIYIKKLEEATQDAHHMITINEKLLNVKDFIDILSKHKKNDILILEKIVNTGLEYVYPHRSLVFYINFVKKRGKIEAEFMLNDKLLRSPFKGEGGGIITIISLLLYIASVSINNEKIVLLDESIKMVDIDAATKFISFLQYFASEKKITVLMISHKKFDYTSEKLTDKIKMIKLED